MFTRLSMSFLLVGQVGAVNILILLATGWVFAKVYGAMCRHERATRLRGPPTESLIFGLHHRYLDRNDEIDMGLEYEQWAEEYGGVYQVPAVFGTKRIVLCDPKASAHFFAKETSTYVQLGLARIAIEQFFGKGILTAEGESHKRQRKALVPAFNNVAIKRLTPIFFESAYKVKDAWDAILNSSTDNHSVIDVQQWMNRISLDSVGIAGFSHDFRSLQGEEPAVATVFESFGISKPSVFTVTLILLSVVFPILMQVPTPRKGLIKKLHTSLGEISNEMLKRSRKEKQGLGKGDQEKSIIGLLLNAEAEGTDSESLTREEIMAQMRTLILAGYETTSISLSWALLELSFHPDRQQKLRDELSQFVSSDPTYEQLSNGLPYLDAVVQEVLRMHPPLYEIVRMAKYDDVIPLSRPIVTRSGATVDRITVAKGTTVSGPIQCINRSIAIWGADAKEFVPERWLEPDRLPTAVKEVSGYRHILTFSDGPRTCLGKGFALAEFKAALSVLIRNYTFELRDGPDTKIETGRGILPRPRIAGEEGNRLPLRVRRVEQ